MKLIRQTGYFTSVSPETPSIVIASVNGGTTPFNSQPSVLVVGSGFTGTQGTVTYDGYPIVANSWSDTVVDIAWADIPFNPDYASYDIGTTLTLTVTSSNGSAGALASTVVNPDSFYATITSIPSGSIYEDDVGVVTGDKGYIRVIAGTVDTIDAATGLVSGASVGAQVEYAIYDVSIGQWASAVEVFLSDVSVK